MIAVLSLALAAGNDEAPHRWTITVDPLTTALGFAHVQVERAFGTDVSFYVGPSLKLWDFPGTEQQPYVGLGVELGFRWYWHARAGRRGLYAPEGPWLMARGVVAHLHTTDGSAQTSLGNYLSALAGYSWIVGDHFTFALGAGVQRLDYAVGDYGIEGILPALHTNLGVAF